MGGEKVVDKLFAVRATHRAKAGQPREDQRAHELGDGHAGIELVEFLLGGGALQLNRPGSGGGSESTGG